MFEADQLQFVREGNQISVQISSSGYRREQLELIQEYCPVEIVQKDGVLSLNYIIPGYFKTVKEEILNRSTELERFSLAQSMSVLVHSENDYKIPYIHPENDYKIPYIHPENIIVFGSNVQMLHYGIEKLLAPQQYSSEFYLESYKALIISILLPKVDFDLVIHGIDAIKEKVAQDIIPLGSVADVNKYIAEKYAKLSEESSKANLLVNKKKWKALLIGGALLATTTVVLSFATYKSMFKDGPLKSSVILAQSNFMRKDYSETVESLKNYGAESLPKEAKYILAASYVRLDSLSDKQKEVILNTITESTDDTIFYYWIYLGRGKFEKALDVAQNIGDTQLILHAYTNLYESVKADINMNGSEKQKKLEEYEKKIKELSAEIGEATTNSSDTKASTETTTPKDNQTKEKSER